MAPSAAIDATDESRDTLLVLGPRNVHAGIIVEEGRGFEGDAEHLDRHPVCSEN